MGLHVDTEGLENEVIYYLKKCEKALDDVQDYLEKIKCPSDIGYTVNTYTANDGSRHLRTDIAQNITSVKGQILLDLPDVKKNVSGDIVKVGIIVGMFSAMEAANQNISSNLGGNVSGNISSDYNNSSSNGVDVPTKDANTKLEDDKGIQTETPNKAEDVDNEEVDIDLEGKVPDSQVEAVIELIYGEEPTLSDDDRQRIAEAILQINETEILEGLDESIANSIRADIVKDYLDGKLELEGITADQLQQYIESQPSINVKFELNESINSFDSLIANGYLTEEQINSVIEQNIQICTEEEFTDAYKEFDNTQTDVSNIESFYDKENNKVYIRNTADSVLITKAIISVLGANILFDDETGQVSYVTDVEDTNINDFSSISMNGEENTVLNDKTNLEDETNLSE